jgi:hypothetical protein
MPWTLRNGPAAANLYGRRAAKLLLKFGGNLFSDKHGGAIELTDNSKFAGKRVGAFSGHGRTFLVLGGATAVLTAIGVVAGIRTNQEATFWSSAWGTAAGGMVAVWAAFFFWARDTFENRILRIADENQTRIQRNDDESAARDQRIRDENERRQRAIDDRSKEVALRILDRAVRVKPLARNMRNSQQDDGQIGDHCDWMKAHTALISNPALRQDLEDAIDMLDPTQEMERYTSLPYTERVYPVVTWIRDLVQNYASESSKEVERPQHYSAMKDAYEQYAKNQEELYALYIADKERQIRESQEQQDKVAAYQEAFGGNPV